MDCQITGCIRNAREDDPQYVTFEDPEGERTTFRVCPQHKLMMFNLTADRNGVKWYGASKIVKTTEEDLADQPAEETESDPEGDPNLSEEELDKLTAPQDPVEGEEN